MPAFSGCSSIFGMPNPHPVLRAAALAKHYGRRQALSGVDLDVPARRIVGLVGPNGAGKSTLLQLACGLIEPSAGTLSVLGARPAADAAHLARVGFVAQDAPVYGALTVADHLRMGARMNPRWDAPLARDRVAQAGLPLTQRAGRLSGGQRAQLALTLAAAKRPELLILDEPAAALDPLARDGFLRGLLQSVSDLGASAILSSHLLADVERVCDHLIVLAGARVQLAGDVPDLLAAHRRIPPGAPLPDGAERIHDAVVRTPVPAGAAVELSELVLAYLGRAAR
ncbi:ABC transporter ATP-binding protein [Dactylosporangium darangshiense]|uniref:ABC transporter ATP-binding protein n=2 Tax=Dactylosporangium darangshiense TaxID=579108 RepID=A0ABP8D198_9ACTN